MVVLNKSSREFYTYFFVPTKVALTTSSFIMSLILSKTNNNEETKTLGRSMKPCQNCGCARMEEKNARRYKYIVLLYTTHTKL